MTLKRKPSSLFKVRRAKPRYIQTRPPETPKSCRHGAPAGPWPWMDFDHISQIRSSDSVPCHDSWRGYPQSLFPNWSPNQVKGSGIYDAVNDRQGRSCTIRGVDIKDTLPFVSCPDDIFKNGDEDRFWVEIQQERPEGVKVRALFLDHPLGPVLQMIGTKYAIEPFFFSSSLNRIPSRYQENHGNSGDHITITLPFVRIVKHGLDFPVGIQTSDRIPEGTLSITHGRLELELLAIHMVRSPQSSTLISFHPKGLRSSAAEHLQSRIMDAGYSVYWKEILESTKDPTFLLLIYLWYAFYAWDQAFEEMYGYINELETTTIVNFEISSAQTIHNVHAHLLNYALLLRDFEESVKFVLNTPNPTIEETLRTHEQERMERECKHLLSEISRLEMGRQIHTERLRNAMDLLFSSVNIKDSEQMQQLTSIAVRDSHAMKQVSILTMVFLPASFAASIFGMNVTNFDTGPNIKGTLAQYLGTAITLTAITIWIIVASQTNAPGSTMRERGWQRLAWPVHLLASFPPFCWIGPKQNGISDDHAEVTGAHSRV